LTATDENAKGPNGELRQLQPEPLIGVLVAHGVDFVVVGGYAVAAHGFVRATKDVDVCPDPAQANLQCLADALAELAAKPIGLDEFAGEFDLEPDLASLQMGGNWTLMTKHGRLDVMQTFNFEGGVEGEGGYKDLAAHTVQRTFLGHKVRFCSYEDLLRMKRAAGRAQDKVDIESLKAARSEF
jgi:hypothetical protein